MPRDIHVRAFVERDRSGMRAHVFGPSQVAHGVCEVPSMKVLTRGMMKEQSRGSSVDDSQLLASQSLLRWPHPLPCLPVVLQQHASSRQHAITAMGSAIDRFQQQAEPTSQLQQNCHDAWHIVRKCDRREYDWISCHGGVQTVGLHAAVADGIRGRSE